MVPYLNTKDLEMIRIPKKEGIEKNNSKIFPEPKVKVSRLKSNSWAISTWMKTDVHLGMSLWNFQVQKKDPTGLFHIKDQKAERHDFSKATSESGRH